MQSPQRVQTRDRTEDQTGHPAPVGVLLQLRSITQLPDTNGVDGPDGVESQVSGVTQLATDSQVAQHWVNGGLVVRGNRSGLEVLSELADTHDFTCRAELLFDSIEGFDGGLRPVGAEKVPGIEAGEILQGTEKLVTTNCLYLDY